MLVPPLEPAQLVPQHLRARPVHCPKRASSCQDACDSHPLLVGDGERGPHRVFAVPLRLAASQGLDRTGGHILDDTVMAVGGDTYAEGRAVSSCDGSGIETPTR